MDISKIMPNLESIAGSKVLLLLSIRESYAYENGKITDNQDGWKAEFVCCDNSYEKVSCKIIAKPPVTQEMIDNSDVPIKCTLDGFESRIYRDFKNSGYGLSCKAKALLVVK